MSRLAEFLRQERQALIGYVRRRIDDAADHEAEDIVQDVAVHLFDRADPSIPIQNLAAYIYRALRNRIIDFYRRKRETVALDEAALASEQDPSLEIEKEEMLDDVFEAMEELAIEERAVVLATEMEGRTFKELSEEWDIPIGTLLARKSRALEKTRIQLTGQTNQKKESRHEQP
ncbi:MAG: sigma-70 family RNA polymerase sigma factor [Candidatus Aminicenantes bacterium]|nr:sigma-70 family RNA polymerase sigma factor [Candidatus Aminicenantes bacterium]